MENKIQFFEKNNVRSVWDEEQEKWWFSILDIIAILTDQPDYKRVRNYWKWLKNKLKEEGSELFSEHSEPVSDTNLLKKENELVSNANQLENEPVTNSYHLKNELVTNCYQLKLLAADGKYYKTDVADTEQILRLVQSIPSKKQNHSKCTYHKSTK